MSSNRIYIFSFLSLLFPSCLSENLFFIIINANYTYMLYIQDIYLRPMLLIKIVLIMHLDQHWFNFQITFS